MSYILDALKKSEKERRKGQLPNLQSEPGIMIIGKRPRNPWHYVGAIVLFAAFCGLVYVLWPAPVAIKLPALPALVEDFSEEQPPEEEKKEESAPAPSLEAGDKWRNVVVRGIDSLTLERFFRPVTRPKQAAPVVAGTAPAAGVPLARLRQMPQAPGHEEPLMEEDAEEEAPDPLLASVRPGAAAVQNGAVPPGMGGPVDRRLGLMQKPSQGGTPPGAPAATGVPDYLELPAAVRDEVPEVRISLHIFSKDKAKSKAVVNGKLKRAGDTIEDELRVEEIVPEGLILSHRGRKFRMKVFE